MYHTFNLTSTLSWQWQFGKQFYKDRKKNENIVDVMEMKKTVAFFQQVCTG
jgi:hypothetical protein